MPGWLYITIIALMVLGVAVVSVTVPRGDSSYPLPPSPQDDPSDHQG